MASDPQLVSVLRRREGLLPVYLERVATADWLSEPLEAARELAIGSPVLVVEGAPDGYSEHQRAWLREARRAWADLDDTQITPESLADLLTVLLQTTLEEAKSSGVARFDQALQPPPFRPTAAHPRAYEGTGARPPKPRAPYRYDLQAVALDPRASKALLSEFSED